jgi:hypothetical protein
MNIENKGIASFRNEKGEMTKSVSIAGKLVPQVGYSAFVPARTPCESLSCSQPTRLSLLQELRAD